MKNKVHRLENGLYYTDSEILIQYRESKDKISQLPILAQLNLCSTDDIKKALKRAGFDLRKLPKELKNKHTK